MIVSVRMPKSLLDKLKDYAKSNDYLDVSEALRSITRKQWLKHLYPELLEMKRLRNDIFLEIKKKSKKEITKKVLDEFKSIREEIKRGNLQ